MKPRVSTKQPETTRRKLVEATTALMLKRGFNATTVDEICAEASLTKGSFFHHFENKDDIGRAAVRAWGEFGQSLYAEAWKEPGEPLEEIHRLFDIMEGFTRRPEPCVCLVGVLSQEMSGEHPGFRAACARELDVWTEMMRLRLEAAKERLKPAVNFDPAEVAWFLNSLWQGSALIARTRQSAEMIRNNLRLARAYVDSLFANPQGPDSIRKKLTKHH
jgi:TetR/AcrR family transcriptional regulator, transcriptional repressor for nem operon